MQLDYTSPNVLMFTPKTYDTILEFNLVVNLPQYLEHPNYLFVRINDTIRYVLSCYIICYFKIFMRNFRYANYEMHLICCTIFMLS